MSAPLVGALESPIGDGILECVPSAPYFGQRVDRDIILPRTIL